MLTRYLPWIRSTLKILNEILKKMQIRQTKRQTMLTGLKNSGRFSRLYAESEALTEGF